MNRREKFLDLVSSLQKPQMFELIRGFDESGLSGTGKVLEGIIFTDGTVAIHWTSNLWSVTFFPSAETFFDIHTGGHPDNRTEINFFPSGEQWRQVEETHAVHRP